MSGLRSRRKGYEGEREFVNTYGGERMPLSGAQGGSFTGDVVGLPYLGRGEIKRRARGFKTIYDWLASNDFLAMRADRKPWLVCMKMDDLKLILEEMDELKKGRV